MPLLTAEAAKLSNDDLRSGIVETIVTSDQVFQVLPFIPVEGRAYVFNRENTLSTASFVDTDDVIGEGAATFTNVNQKLKRIVGDVDVDNYLNSGMSDTNPQAGIQVAKKAKTVARTWADCFINGSQANNVKQFDGLIVLANQTQAQVVPSVNAAGDALSFTVLDTLMDLVKVGGQLAFIMNSRTIRAYMALARLSGGLQATELMVPGIVGPVVGYRGIPILKNDYIPLTQDSRDASVHTTTSIFLGALEENEGIAGLMDENQMGIEVEKVGPVQNKDATRWRVKWYSSMALHSTLALAMATGITN